MTPATKPFFARPRRRSAPEAAVAASDEQITVLVVAARRLARRERDRGAGTPASEERLQRLDWAVRAGQSVLADRRRAGP